MWNINSIKNLSHIQKRLLISGFEAIKKGGIIVYSTCTHAPEENEEVVDFLIKKFPKKIKIEKINLPLKSRPGIEEWKDKKYDPQIKNCRRIYPQDNNTEGFFIAKIKKMEN